MRTGDICLHCIDNQFFENVYSFIRKGINDSVASSLIQNIVVHQPDYRIHETFKNIPNVVLFNHTDASEAVGLFMNADILVATGSSFVRYKHRRCIHSYDDIYYYLTVRVERTHNHIFPISLYWFFASFFRGVKNEILFCCLFACLFFLIATLHCLRLFISQSLSFLWTRMVKTILPR